MDVSYLRLFLDYHYWARERLLDTDRDDFRRSIRRCADAVEGLDRDRVLEGTARKSP